jgi:hypothetical protein
MVGVLVIDMSQTATAYTVELSTEGYKREEVYYTTNPADARRAARDDYPDALIYEVDTL